MFKRLQHNVIITLIFLGRSPNFSSDSQRGPWPNKNKNPCSTCSPWNGTEIILWAEKLPRLASSPFQKKGVWGFACPLLLEGIKNQGPLRSSTGGRKSSFLSLGNASTHPLQPHSQSGKLEGETKSQLQFHRLGDKPPLAWPIRVQGQQPRPRASTVGVWPPSPHLLLRTHEHQAHKLQIHE